MEKNLVVFHKDYSSLLLPEPWGSLLRSSLWESGGVPWGKMCGVPPRHFPTSLLNLQQFCQNHPISVPTSLWLRWLLLQASRSGLWLWICLSRFLGGTLPCYLSSLRSMKSLLFSEFSLFYCKDMSNDSQALYMSELKVEVRHVFLNSEIYNIGELWKK